MFRLHLKSKDRIQRESSQKAKKAAEIDVWTALPFWIATNFTWRSRFIFSCLLPLRPLLRLIAPHCYCIRLGSAWSISFFYLNISRFSFIYERQLVFRTYHICAFERVITEIVRDLFKFNFDRLFTAIFKHFCLPFLRRENESRFISPFSSNLDFFPFEIGLCFARLETWSRSCHLRIHLPVEQRWKVQTRETDKRMQICSIIYSFFFRVKQTFAWVISANGHISICPRQSNIVLFGRRNVFS